MRVGGIVLCGGRSSRMGRPKAWLPVGGEFMLQRVVRVVGEVVEPVVVVASPGQDVPPLPVGVEIVRDAVEGLGPLAGLVVGLAALEGKADAAYLSACDVPLLRAGFVRRVVELLNDSTSRDRKGSGESATRSLTVAARYDACVPDVGGFLHPLAAAYRFSVRPVLADLLAAGRMRPTFLFDAVPTRFLAATDFADVDPALDSLRNANTPEEYAAVLQCLSDHDL